MAAEGVSGGPHWASHMNLEAELLPYKDMLLIRMSPGLSGAPLIK